MQSEIQFFMTQTDQEEFFAYAETLVDRLGNDQDDKPAGTTIFSIGKCKLLFTPSPFENNTLFAGKISINTLDEKGKACDEEQRAKKTYRDIKKWIKKNYWSRLAYLDKTKNNKLTPSRAYFLGSDAKKWKDSNPGKHKLKLSATSWVVFEIGI